MSGSNAGKSSTAKAPFDNPEGDIILQSADGMNFHVLKIILSLALDMFQTMFTLPQETTQSDLDISSAPIIPMTEVSETLRPLLLLCYPSTNPIFCTLEHAKDVLKAARKYDMEVPIRRARDIIFTRFLETKPLELYALSCEFGWQQHIQKAAFQTLQIGLKDLGRPDSSFLGIKDINAYDYHKLLRYHNECGVAAQAVGESLEWLLYSPGDLFIMMCMRKCVHPKRGKHDTMCKRMRAKVSVGCSLETLVTPWFHEYLTSSGKRLYARPCESTIWNQQDRATYNCAIKKAIGCGYCRSKVVEHMECFRTLYAAQVTSKKVLAKMRLDID